MPERKRERESMKAYHCILRAFIKVLAIEIARLVIRQVSYRKSCPSSPWPTANIYGVYIFLLSLCQPVAASPTFSPITS